MDLREQLFSMIGEHGAADVLRTLATLLGEEGQCLQAPDDEAHPDHELGQVFLNTACDVNRLAMDLDEAQEEYDAALSE